MLTSKIVIRSLSFEGIPASKRGLLPLLRLEKGFQAIERSGRGYIEEIAGQRGGTT
jgi:hypothetical protein